MGERVDSRDVLDVDGIIKKGFRGEIVGHFRPTGPDSWDPYERVERREGEIDVRSGIRVQLEELGAAVRMRSHGRVVVVRWPRPEELADANERDVREAFLAAHVKPHDDAPGMGAAAVIAKTLAQDD